MDTSRLRQLRSQGEQVLRDLESPVRAAARLALDQATFLVPRGGAPEDPLNLADTGFLSGPVHNTSARLSVTFTCGYAHPQAGPIHEGFHWGEQTRTPPPHFLRKAAKRGVRALLRKGVQATLWKSLSRIFPSQ